MRAERRCGEILAEMEMHGGDRKSKLHDATLNLADIGIERTQSHRWQAIASIPEPDFEQHGTFEDYCLERWGWSRIHAHHQVAAARFEKSRRIEQSHLVSLLCPEKG